MGVNLIAIAWTPCYRIIPSRFPPVQLFEKVADPEDLDAVFQLESLTNSRLREEVGELHLVPTWERVTGPGAGYVMAAFTHLNPHGSRFSDGSFGVYYAGRELETAIAETIHHHVVHLTYTHEPPQDLDMRVFLADLRAELVAAAGPELLDPADYGPGQRFAMRARAEGRDGIAYESVRHRGGACAGVFRPRCLGNCRQSAHLIYPWDGGGILRNRVTRKELLAP